MMRSSRSLDIDQIATYCSELENAIARYIYEAHIKSLEGVNFCDHAVGVCFCEYFEALHRVVDVCGKSPFNGVHKKTADLNELKTYKQKNTSLWTLELQAILTAHASTQARYIHLRELLFELIHTDELSKLIADGETTLRDKKNFESIIKSVLLHIKIHKS